jgi:hypothetical protein
LPNVVERRTFAETRDIFILLLRSFVAAPGVISVDDRGNVGVGQVTVNAVD